MAEASHHMQLGGSEMSEQNPQTDTIARELDKLGDNLNNLFRAIWESDERRTMEREITAGLEQVNKSVNEAANKIRADENTDKLKKSVKDAWETARGPQIMHEIETGITNTLAKLNEEISKRAQPAQEVKPEAKPADIVDAEVKPVGATKPE
jgi:hypothetical protein